MRLSSINIYLLLITQLEKRSGGEGTNKERRNESNQIEAYLCYIYVVSRIVIDSADEAQMYFNFAFIKAESIDTYVPTHVPLARYNLWCLYYIQYVIC